MGIPFYHSTLYHSTILRIHTPIEKSGDWEEVTSYRIAIYFLCMSCQCRWENCFDKDFMDTDVLLENWLEWFVERFTSLWCVEWGLDCLIRIFPSEWHVAKERGVEGIVRKCGQNLLKGSFLFLSSHWITSSCFQFILPLSLTSKHKISHVCTLKG